MVIIHDSTVPVYTQTDFHEATRDDELQALQTRFLEFKRFAFDEIALLRSKKSADENNNCLKPLLRSMELRIISLINLSVSSLGMFESTSDSVIKMIEELGFDKNRRSYNTCQK